MKEVIMFLLIVAFVFTVLGLAMAAGSRRHCEEYGRMSEREVRFSARAGCFVRTSEGWRNTDELRVVEGGAQ